jgi:hypothetical protein
MWTKKFLVSLLERVIATFVMTFLAISGLDAGGAVGDQGLDQVNWIVALQGAAVAAGLSAIKGILANLVTGDGPGLTHAEQVQPSVEGGEE